MFTLVIYEICPVFGAFFPRSVYDNFPGLNK